MGGEAWEIHGGGFYRVEKFRLAPARLPESLQWFKWEAYLTWLSGFALLVLLYYVDPRVFLLDPAVADLEPWQAVAASLALLGVGWVAYDALSRRLEARPMALALGIAALVALAAWLAGQVFAPRAAYIQVGATIGTWMAANVFFVIIPGQRELVSAKIGGRDPDPVHGLRGKQRSVHNNYLTLPVVFAMISQHFPFTYGREDAWLVLLALMAAGVAVQHFLNLRHDGRKVWALPALAVALVGALALTGAPPLPPAERLTAADFPRVEAVIGQRCVACHARSPTHPGFSAPPQGVALETARDVKARARQIYQQVVATRVMPLGNVTAMTEEERELISRWYRSGAPVP